MAKLLQTLPPILFLLLAAAATTARSQSTSFTYDFYGIQPTDLTYQGDAHFPSDSTFLRLTSPTIAISGRVLYTNPVQFWQAGGQVDFETSVSFIITPNPGHLNADGFAFFIAPVGSTIPPGPSGPGLGIFNTSGDAPGVFAVEFDTFTNRWDPSYRHIGIDLGSWVSSNTTNVGNAIIGQQVNARINYVGATRMISVVVTAGSETFEVSYEYDLRELLAQEVQVGLSASTGLSGNYICTNDVVSWYFTATMANAGAKADEAYIRKFGI